MGGTILSYRESYREILNKPTVTPVVSRGYLFSLFSILGPPRTGQPLDDRGRSRRSAGCADGRRCDAEAGA